MNILLLTSHAIAEYDDLRMFTDLGYDIFSIGGAYDEVPFEGKRPPIPNAIHYPQFMELCERQRQRDEVPGPYIDWAKGDIHPEIVEWADAIIVHHFPERWIGDQWARIGHKRVIWRTCGQSDPRLEESMHQYRRLGMEIVRYSPKEKRAFSGISANGAFAGEDALIRFGKYPSDYGPWTGEDEVIGNITQDMAKRGDATGYDRWLRLTQGFPVLPAGPGSEAIGGYGTLTYPEMLAYLTRIRCYLYTGTMPASYTLGLIEAMLSGIPIICRGWNTPSHELEWLGQLWEGSDIVHPGFAETDYLIREDFRLWLADREYAAMVGERCRQRAIELFDVATVGAQWKAFLE